MDALSLNSPNLIDEQSSKRITVLRFLLSVFVVLIHSKLKQDTFIEGFNLELSIPKHFDVFQRIFSGTFTACAVPLFFVFSGYLHFGKECSYSIMLKKKTKAIIIPYFIWILTFILFYGVADILGFTETHIADKTIKQWFNIFTGFPANSQGRYCPMVGQFWYLRDLMLMFLLSPIIKIAIKKVPLFYFTVAFIFWQSKLPLSYEWGEAFVFFGIGCFAIQNGFKVEMVDKINWISILPLYFIILCFFIYEFITGNSPSTFIGIANIFTISIILLKIAGKWTSNEKLFNILKKLSVYSFWIYAVHIPWFLCVAQRFAVKIVLLNSSVGFYIAYLMIFVFGVTGSLISGILLNKIIPPLFRLYTGGRFQKKNKLA